MISCDEVGEHSLTFNDLAWLSKALDYGPAETDIDVNRSQVFTTPTSQEWATGYARTSCSHSDVYDTDASDTSGKDSPVRSKAKAAQKKHRMIRTGSKLCDTKESSKNSKTFSKGRWGPEELAVLMLVADACAAEELHVICEICKEAGLHRPHRAIDKQLKRTLKYDRWQDRNIKLFRQQIAQILNQRLCCLAPEKVEMIDRIRKAYLSNHKIDQKINHKANAKK